LEVEDFIDGDVEAAINAIRQLNENPEIKFPGWFSPFTLHPESRPSASIWNNHFITLDLASLVSLAQTETWDNQLRILQKFIRMYFVDALPSWVYCGFHEFLHLTKFEPEECLGGSAA